MSKFEQRKFYLLMVLILVVTFVDIAGVASIFPFLMILANPEIIQTNKIFYYFYLKASILGVDNFNEFIFGDKIKVKNNLCKILKLLKQEPILLVDMI